MSTSTRVIVTGAAKGIGLATARKFAASGARACLFDTDADSLKDAGAQVAEAGAEGVLEFHGSVTDGQAIAACVAQVVAEWGGVDALINSAGVVVAASSIDMDEADWRRVVDINLTESFLFARAVAAEMVAAEHGSIVNLSSIYGRSGAPQRAAYCATKAGVVGLTQSLAVEWAPHGVRVNAVAPAYTRTEMVGAMIEAGHVDIDSVLKRTPMNRLIEPDDVANACVFLCSEGASSITGQVLGVDAGWQAFGFYS